MLKINHPAMGGGLALAGLVAVAAVVSHSYNLIERPPSYPISLLIRSNKLNLASGYTEREYREN